MASPLSDDAVRDALGTSTPSAGVVTPSRHPEPDADDGPLRTVTTRGGVVSARCVERQPSLLYATPAQGYRTDRSSDTLVRFESSRRAVTVTLSCDGLLLRTSTRTESISTSPAPHPSTTAPRPSPSETESESPEPSRSPSPEKSDDHSGEG